MAIAVVPTTMTECRPAAEKESTGAENADDYDC
jgi:hypothetical protein